MNKWLLVLDGCIIGLYGGLIATYFDDIKPTTFVICLCILGIIAQLGVVCYRRRD